MANAISNECKSRILEHAKASEFTAPLREVLQQLIASLDKGAHSSLDKCYLDKLAKRAIESPDKLTCLDITISVINESQELLGNCDLSRVYLELACELHHLGVEHTALELANRVLEITKHAATTITRRAHNIAAASLFRTFDFEQSCEHLAIGYQIAQQLDDSIGKYAILANVVAMLETIGLIEEAKALSGYLVKRSTNEIPDVLKFQVAINGALLCSNFVDDEMFRAFHAESKKHRANIPDIHDDWNSIYDSHEIHHLILRGCRREATRYLAAAFAKRPALADLRVLTYLYCAEGELNLSFGDRSALVQSRRKIRKLLSSTGINGYCKEHALRALIRLYDKGSPRERTVGSAFLQLLREHLVGAKHRLFFENSNISQAAWSGMALCKMEEVRQGFSDSKFDGAEYIEGLRNRTRSNNFTVEWKAISEDLRKGEVSTRMGALRSFDYFIAENWAVAAEVAAGRTGRHCFQVGRVAALVALAAGWPEDASERLELACRLHDLGNVAVERDVLCSSREERDDTSRHHREHTLAGERLLGLSSDAVLQLSSRIAAAHHEWWNGCGYPKGAAGVEIPIEARICAVANCFVMALETHNGRQWNLPQAVRQVVSMAGVQLDPELVDYFITIVRHMSFREDMISEIIESDTIHTH